VPRGVDLIRAIKFTKELIEIIKQVHQVNIRHRDIKPNNIVLTTTGQLTKPILIDFRLAAIDDDDAEPKNIEIINDFETQLHEGITNKFCQIPIMFKGFTGIDKEMRRSERIDVAQLCAIFLYSHGQK
jgi:serine/threonine protein kinase